MVSHEVSIMLAIKKSKLVNAVQFAGLQNSRWYLYE
jgi:hypothetical protein